MAWFKRKMPGGTQGADNSQGSASDQGIGGANIPAVPSARPGANLGLTEAQPVNLNNVTQEDVKKVLGVLQAYKQGKHMLETRIVEEEKWFKLRHWEAVNAASASQASTDSTTNGNRPASENEPASGLLFSAIRAKHADAMDNFPESNILPRERSDEPDAKILSSIIPVIMERCRFEASYSDSWWEKLKHGTAAYGVFWNSSIDNGLGDIDIRQVDILNLFWEPGVKDIQKSRNFFCVGLRDVDQVDAEFPKLKGQIGTDTTILKQYEHDDTVDLTNKCLMIDHYYKVTTPDGRTIVHLTKIAGDKLLFASQNMQQYVDTGFYDHGLYPFHFDVMFPDKDTPTGFGLIAILKDPQLYYDRLSAAVLENAILSTKPRFLQSDQSNINKDDLLDITQAVISVAGPIDDAHIKQILISPIPTNTINVMEQKQNELKETAANRDFNNGSVASGVTAASAISALQESGNKTSRDEISTSYRCYNDIVNMAIELMRQFYTEARYFRVIGDNAEYQFIEYNNERIKAQPTGTGAGGVPMFRKPIFDIKIKAQRKNPFSRAAQNELALGLYKMGFFNPQKAQESMIALNLMEFEGKDKVLEQVMQGQTLLNVCKQMSVERDALAAIVQQITGVNMGISQQGTGKPQAAPAGKGGDSANPGKITGAQAKAQKPQTGSKTNIANRSVPNMNTQAGKVGMP